MKFKEKRLRIIIICISWLLVGLCMAAIFIFSSQSGEESKELSSNLLSKIVNLIGDVIGHNTLRKITHSVEYFGLALLTFNALSWTYYKKRPFAAYLICLLYSITDEIHQYFIPGRACRIFDIFVDSLGSVAAILMCLLFISLAIKIRRGKTNEGVQQND